jgi:hypothetical protein
MRNQPSTEVLRDINLCRIGISDSPEKSLENIFPNISRMGLVLSICKSSLGASDAQTDLGTFDFVDNLSVQGLLPK